MDPTVAGVIVTAVVSVLIFAMRMMLSWGLGKKAIERGVSMKISGLNPLAPSDEIGQNDIDPSSTTGPTVLGQNGLLGRAAGSDLPSSGSGNVSQLRRRPHR